MGNIRYTALERIYRNLHLLQHSFVRAPTLEIANLTHSYRIQDHDNPRTIVGEGPAAPPYDGKARLETGGNECGRYV